MLRMESSCNVPALPTEQQFREIRQLSLAFPDLRNFTLSQITTQIALNRLGRPSLNNTLAECQPRCPSDHSPRHFNGG